jgi:hypothetical protein
MQKNIVQLRQLLAERFPHLRSSAREPAARAAAVWPTGLAQIDQPLQGGLPRGGISELVVPHPGAGGALLAVALLRAAHAGHQLAALIDGQNSFDPCALDQETLNRLLWVRCDNAAQALQAVDLVLRDRNLPVVLLDLQLNPETQLRKIPPTTWYRLQRIVEQTGATLFVLSPRKLAGGVRVRLELRSRFGLEALDSEADLLSRLVIEITDSRKAAGWNDPGEVRRTA